MSRAQPAVEERSVAVIESGALTWRSRDTLGFPLPEGKRATVLVPAEQVLLVAIDLPLLSHRQRLEVAPFAVEGMLAEPLSAVHIALGPQIGPKRYLVGAVRRETMAGWIVLLDRSGLAHARIVPDALTLPAPQADGWAVFASGSRAVVRKGDRAGFAIDLSALVPAWRLARCPAVNSYGDPLPLELAAQESTPFPEVADAVSDAFDLRQGLYAPSGLGTSGFLRRAGWVAGVGAAILSAILVLDTIALHRLADERREAAKTLLQRVMPGVVPEEDIAGQLARLLPDDGANSQGRFLPMLASVAGALNGKGDGLSVQNLSYYAGERQLSLEVTAADLAALQRIEAAMTGAGIQAVSGVATAESGAAEVRIVVQDTGGGS